MPERKRNRSDKTPSPPEQQPDPAKRPPKQRVTSTPAPQPKPPSVKRPPQNPPPSRQSTTLDAFSYAPYPTSNTRRGEAGGLSGAGTGDEPDPRPPFTGSSAFGYSAQQPRPAIPLSPYHPSYGQASNPPHNPSSGSRAPPPPPPPPYGREAMDPPTSRHRQGRRPRPSTYTGEENVENSPPAPQSQPEAPEKESEDGALIRLREENIHKQKGVKWENVSKEMKALFFNRDAEWCRQRWHAVLNPSSGRAWSQAEDDALRTLKGKSPNWDWEVISSDMGKQGFYRDVKSCRAHWQEFLMDEFSEGPLSSVEKEIIADLKSKGKTYPEIIDALERKGFKRRKTLLANVKYRSQFQG